MAVVSALLGLLGLGDDDSSVDALKAALREPRTEMGVYGQYGEPRLNAQGAKTAVFPVTLYDAETGEEYDEPLEVEFEIERDAGKESLDAFLDSHGLGRDNLEEVEGEMAAVERTADGNLVVDW